MDYHLDRAFKLHTQIEHKRLYDWALVEIDENGKAIGSGQIPWIWDLTFSANDCLLGDNIEIKQDFSINNEGNSPRTTESYVIKINMRPNNAHGDEASWRNTRFSMFGTDRIISEFQLDIRPLNTKDQQEYCRAWGIPSYSSEIDFQHEKSDDVLGFHLHVKPDTFNRYVDMIKANAVSDVTFRVGRVDGFYSEWSPGISTGVVKVLTSHKDHEFQNSENLELQPPRLGKVGETALHFMRRTEFRKQNHTVTEDAPAAIAQPGIPDGTSAIIITDPEIKAGLKSLKTVGWWIAALLALIALNAVWR